MEYVPYTGTYPEFPKSVAFQSGNNFVNNNNNVNPSYSGSEMPTTSAYNHDNSVSSPIQLSPVKTPTSGCSSETPPTPLSPNCNTSMQQLPSIASMTSSQCSSDATSPDSTTCIGTPQPVDAQLIAQSSPVMTSQSPNGSGIVSCPTPMTAPLLYGAIRGNDNSQAAVNGNANVQLTLHNNVMPSNSNLMQEMLFSSNNGRLVASSMNNGVAMEQQQQQHPPQNYQNGNSGFQMPPPHQNQTYHTLVSYHHHHHHMTGNNQMAMTSRMAAASSETETTSYLRIVSGALQPWEQELEIDVSPPSSLSSFNSNGE